jgi:chitosanase
MNELQQKTARAIVNVFETGRVRGNYSAIAVLKGDSGHLSYGRSQSTLGSGSLGKLLVLYCQQPGAKFVTEIQAFLPDVQKKDFTLDTNDTFRQLLKRAGSEDPVMRTTQDRFFDDNYLVPACTAGEKLGITEALGQTVIYDSHVQGGWGTLKARMPEVNAVGAKQWVKDYVKLRTGWLKSLKDPLPTTVYRMEAFDSMISADNWNLTLPLTAHGVTITSDALDADTLPAGSTRRTLVLVTPYLRGEDVREVQAALGAKSFPIGKPDGAYGPFTSQLVADWQKQQNIAEKGVGPLTRNSLGLPP